jgi:hypothetical protein
MMLAHRLEIQGEFPADLRRDLTRNADASRLRQFLQPRGYVDAFAVAIVILCYHLAEVDADADIETLAIVNRRIALCHAALEDRRTFHRAKHTVEFR